MSNSSGQPQTVFGNQAGGARWNTTPIPSMTPGTGTYQQNMQGGIGSVPGNAPIGNQVGWYFNTPQATDPSIYGRWNWYNAMNPSPGMGGGMAPPTSSAPPSSGLLNPTPTAPSSSGGTGVGLSKATVPGMPAWQGSTPLNYNEQQARKTAWRATQGQGGQIGQEVLRKWQEDHPNDLLGTPSVSTNNFGGTMTGQPGAIAFNPGETSEGYMQRIGMKPADIQAAMAMSKANPGFTFQDILHRLGTGG